MHNHALIIMPSCSGRSTFAARHPGIVVDLDPRSMKLSALVRTRLDHMRSHRMWDAYRRSYQRQIRRFARELPGPRVLLLHSLTDAMAVFPLLMHRTMFVFPEHDEWLERRASLHLSGERHALAALNYASVAESIVMYGEVIPARRSPPGAPWAMLAPEWVSTDACVSALVTSSSGPLTFEDSTFAGPHVPLPIKRAAKRSFAILAGVKRANFQLGRGNRAVAG